MKKTLFLAAFICAFVFGTITTAAARHKKDALDSMLYVMKKKERKNIKKLHNETVNLIAQLREKLVAKNIPITYNAQYGDTAYFYEYRNIRIGKTEEWAMLGNSPSVPVKDADDYFYMEGRQIEKVTAKEQWSYYYLQALNNQKAIMPEHFHREKSKEGHNVYAFDRNPVDGAYASLFNDLSTFKQMLQKTLQEN